MFLSIYSSAPRPDRGTKVANTGRDDANSSLPELSEIPLGELQIKRRANEPTRTVCAGCGAACYTVRCLLDSVHCPKCGSKVTGER